MPIGYSVTDYVDNSVPYITATTLNNSEAGIKAACDAIDAMETLVTTDGLLLTPSLESEPTYANGLIFIHPDEKCPSVYTGIDGVVLNLSQELTSRGVNATGDTLPNGTIGYMSGVLGNRPTIAPAQANSATTAKVYGMFTHDVANNVEGFVTHIGLVHDLDTSAFEAGDTLYLSATTPGAFTNVAPTAPNYVLEVGRVLVSHATQGIIFFSVPSTSVLTGIVVNSVTVNNDVIVGGSINGRDIEADGTKLDNIEALADVTDAGNVSAAGAVMESDTSTAAMSFVVDEDDMLSNSNIKLATQQSIKAYVDAVVSAILHNSTQSIQGGTTDEYYHLTSDELTTVQAILSGNIDSYSNHTGTIDNMCSKTETNSGTVTEDSTNHAFDLDAGTTANSVAAVQFKRTITPSGVTKAIITAKVLSLATGTTTGGKALNIGLYESDDNKISFRSTNFSSFMLTTTAGGRSSGSSLSTAVTVGDTISLVITSTSVKAYVNGVNVATNTVNIPSEVAMYPTVIVSTYGTAPSVAPAASIDLLEYKVIR